MGNDGVRWRLGLGGSAVRQVTLRSLTAFSVRFALGGNGVTMGLPPHTLLGDSSPNPFFASRRLNAALTESGFASLPDSRL